MKAYCFDGRLGNQLFQFAHLYSDVVANGGYDYAVSVCPIDVERLQYKPQIVDKGEFTGYWESEQHFNQELIHPIYSPTPKQVEAIHAKYGDFTNSLFISVRRGDFVKLGHRFVCVNAAFYNDMYDMLTKKMTYSKVLITSDDFGWCKKNLKMKDNVVWLEDENPYDTIMIGSQCKDFIISASTFAWWCAWLGEKNGGEIVCPNAKFHSGFKQDDSWIFFPERWHRIDARKYYEGLRMKVLLCGIAKQENHYIREWVKWYRDIGVDHIVLYDNNDPDGEHFDEVIGDYIERGFVEVIDWRGRKQCQHAAYGECYKRYNKEYDWLMFLDIDELLRIDRIPFDRKVKNFLGQKIFDGYDGVKICWKCLTDGGMLRVENGDYRMFDRFKEVLDKENKHNKYVKIVVRGGLGELKWESAHYPKGLRRVCDTLGRFTKPKNHFDRAIWTKAVLLHYKFKTIEEYCLNKMQRLYPDHDDEYSKWRLSLDFFFTINERTQEKEALAAELLKDK